MRNGFLTEEEAAATLARPLRLRAGRTLAPLRLIDLAPGPAFVWWQLTLGAVTATTAALALAASRIPRLRASAPCARPDCFCSSFSC